MPPALKQASRRRLACQVWLCDQRLPAAAGVAAVVAPEAPTDGLGLLRRIRALQPGLRLAAMLSDGPPPPGGRITRNSRCRS